MAGDVYGSRPPVRYVGKVADWWGRHVWLEHADTRTQLRYSPGSVITFAWGRGGLGTRELARSILNHATGEPVLPEALYGCFAREVIATLPEPGFVLERADILAWLGRQPEPDSNSDPLRGKQSEHGAV